MQGHNPKTSGAVRHSKREMNAAQRIGDDLSAIADVFFAAKPRKSALSGVALRMQESGGPALRAEISHAMTKSRLVAALADETDLSRADAAEVFQSIFQVITEALHRGEDVTLRGFGSFKVESRPAREGRNPRTGQPMRIDACRTPKFIPAKSLKSAVAE